MMTADSFVLPSDNLERQNQKLRKITEALIYRIERSEQRGGAGYENFHAAIVLGGEINQRTHELEEALDRLYASNAMLEEANRATRAAQSNLTNALEAIHEGFALFDCSDCLIMRNSHFAKMFPDIQQTIQPGIAFADYIRNVARSCHFANHGLEEAERWIEKRLAIHGKIHDNFILQLAGDRWIQVSEQHTPSGGTALLQTDVTDMVRLERQERTKLLDEQSLIVRTTLDHIDQGICLFDQYDRLAVWNSRVLDLLNIPVKHFRTGLSVESFMKYLDGFTKFTDDPLSRQFLKWMTNEPKTVPLRVQLSQINGPFLEVAARGIPDGGFVISFSDNSTERQAIFDLHTANESLEIRVASRTEELAKARDEAEKANASKTRFVAAASHDLLQPISAAKLFFASLKSLNSESSQLELIDRIDNAFASIEAQLDALLDISKLDTGVVSFNVEQLMINDLLDNVREQFEGAAALSGNDLRVHTSSLSILSDAAYLQRIVHNLVSNALRYTSNGKVLVGVRRCAEGVRIEVHDTGVGIAPDNQEIIYGEFKRIDPASSVHGMGLGLAIVQRACALLNHPLSLRSELGRGSCFAVTVPMGVKRPRVNIDASKTERLEQSFDGLIILIIENDIDVRAAIISLLETWGAAVLEASNEAEAIEAINDLSMVPDVILCDYHLAANNGIDVIASLRKRFGYMAASLVTADRAAALDDQAKKLQIEILHKPIAPRSLRSLLAYLCKTKTKTNDVLG